MWKGTYGILLNASSGSFPSSLLTSCVKPCSSSPYCSTESFSAFHPIIALNSANSFPCIRPVIFRSKNTVHPIPQSYFQGNTTFIEPEILPCGISDKIPRPRVTCFVSDDVHIRAISSDESWCDSCEIWILHASVRKRFSEHEDIVGRPFVGGNEFFCNGNEGLCVGGEFILTIFEERRFSVQRTSWANWSVRNVCC